MAGPKQRRSGEFSGFHGDRGISGPLPTLGQKRHLAPVRDILTALERALKSEQLYPDTSPVPGELKRAFFERLAAYLDEHQTLRLTIVCDEIYQGDDLVYDGGGDERNFAFALFDGGIKELVFHAGIEPEELSGLLSALNTGIQSDAESVAATLWQQSPRHLSFLVVDLVADDPALPQDESQLAERASAVHDRLRDRLILLEQVVDMRRRPQDAREAERREDRAPGQDPDQQAFTLDPEASEALRGRVLELGRVPAASEALDLVRALIAAGPEVAATERLFGLLAHLLPQVAEQGDVGRLLRTLGAVRSALDERGLAPGMRLALEALLGKAARPEVVRLIAQRLRQDDVGAAVSYIRALGSLSLRVVSGLLGRSPYDRDVVQAVAEASLQSLAALREALTSPDEAAAWLAVRVLVDQLGERAIPDLLRAADHPSPKVRIEALTALARGGGVRGAGRVLEAIDDRDPQVRRKALEVLLGGAATLSPELAPSVRALVEAARFVERPPDEQRGLYTLLARVEPIGGAAYLDALVRRFHLLGRREATARKLIAIEALGRAATGASHQALEQLAPRLGGELRRVCDEALARSRAQRG